MTNPIFINAELQGADVFILDLKTPFITPEKTPLESWCAHACRCFRQMRTHGSHQSATLELHDPAEFPG
jgi:hypothetical protein